MWLLLLGLAHASDRDLYRDPLNASEPLAIRLDLEVDPRQPVFHGEVDADLSVHTSVTKLGFTGWDMDYRNVKLTIDGDKVSTRRNGSLELTWTKKRGGTSNLRVEYDGTLWTNRTTGLVRQQVGDQWHVTSRLFPDQAPYLLPLTNKAKHHVPWTISARVPVGMRALSNGVITSDTPDGEGWHKVTFAATPKLTSRQVALAVGPFREVKIGAVGEARVPVTVWLPAGSDVDTAWMKAEISALVRALEASTGVSYPDPKLDIVAVDGQLDAVHHFGLMTIGLQTIDLPPDAPAHRRTATVRQLANELAAAWTGGHRSPTSLDHTWLRAGLGSWLADRAVFGVHVDWTAEDYIADDVQLLLEYAQSEPDRSVRSNVGTQQQRDSLRHPVHSLRGAAAMRSMQALYGDDAIDQVISAYFSGRRRPATVRTLDDIVRKKLGNEAVDDLDHLLDFSQVPTITATARCPPGRPARVRLRQTAANIAPAQRTPVCVRWGGGEQGPGESCIVLKDGRGTIVIDNYGAPPPGEITTEPEQRADDAPADEATDDAPAEPLRPSPNCPTWTLANAAGTGLYRVSRTFDEAQALLRGDLTYSERANVASDAMAQLPFAQAISLQPALFEHANLLPLDLRSALTYAHAVDSSSRARWNTLLSEHLPAHVVRDKPAVHRGPLQQQAHTASTRLRGVQLADSAVIDDAADKSQRWIDNYNTVGLGPTNPLLKRAGGPNTKHWPTAEVLSVYLPIAVYHGRIDNIKKLTAHLMAVRDPDLRMDLVRALAAERSPERIEQILDDLLKYRVGSVHVRIILEGALAQQATRPAAQAFIEANLDTLQRRMQLPDRTSLIRLGMVGCYEGQSDDILRLFAKRAVDWPGGPEAVDAAVARADTCRARAKEDELAMSAWLQAH